MVCLHRAGHCSGTKSKNLLPSLSIFQQWRGQSFPRHQLLMVDRPTTENTLVSTSIHVRCWLVGQPFVDHLSMVDRPATPAGCNFRRLHQCLVAAQCPAVVTCWSPIGQWLTDGPQWQLRVGKHPWVDIDQGRGVVGRGHQIHI